MRKFKQCPGCKSGDEDDNTEEPDEETKELMVNYDLDIDEAEEVKDIMDEYGVDEDDAIQLRDEL